MIRVNAWEFLEISPTMDVKVIKRAYARKLRDAHPEDEIEAFQSLQEAYKAALQEAKYLSSIAVEDVVNQNDNLDEASGDGHIVHSVQSESYLEHDQVAVTLEEDAPTEKSTRDEETVEDAKNVQHLEHPEDPVNVENEEDDTPKVTFPEWFMHQIHTLYHDYNARIKLENWQYMLSFEEVRDFEYYSIISRSLWEYLKQFNQLPQPILRLLEEQFNWLEQKDSVHSSDADDHDFYDYYYYLITRPWSYEFPEFLEISEDINPDAFIFYREKARQALSTNDLEQAERYLNEAQALYGDDFDVLRLYGEYLVRTDRQKEANLIYERLIREFPYEESVMLQYGTFLVAEKRIKEAMRLYQDILAKDSNSLQAMTGIAICYQHYGQLQEAKDILELIKEENPSEVIAQVMLADLNMKMISEIRGKLAFATDLNKLKFELAQLYFETDQFEICCNLLEQITAHGGANSAVYLLWGQAKLSLEQYERSKELLYIAKQLAEEEGTNGYDIKVALGEVLLDLNLYEQAQLQLTVAFEMNPLNPHVNYLLGQVYQYQQQYESAIYYITKAISQKPENWRFYQSRALSFYNLWRWEEALEDLDFTLSEFRFYAYGRLLKGNCHMHLKQYEQGAASYRKAIDYLHDDYTYFNLAVAYVELDNYSEALFALEEYMKQYNHIEGYILKGDIYRATEDYEKAWETYCLGVEQKPTSYIIVQRAVYTYMNHIFPRKEEQVLEWMENILTEYPWDRWMTVNMIRILINSKSWQDATILASNFYYELEEDDTAKEWASFYTGVAYYHRGNAEEAYFWLQYALNKDREPFSLIYSSMACLQLKKNKEALMYAEEAIQLVTDNADYQQVYEVAKQANQGMMKRLLSRPVISLNELFNLVLIVPEEPSEIDKFFTTLWR